MYSINNYSKIFMCIHPVARMELGARFSEVQRILLVFKSFVLLEMQVKYTELSRSSRFIFLSKKYRQVKHGRRPRETGGSNHDIKQKTYGKLSRDGNTRGEKNLCI